MTENASRLNGFDLSHEIDENSPKPDEFENEAMAAARLLNEAYTHDAKTGLLKQEVWFNDLSEIIENLDEDDVLIVYFGDLNSFKAVNDDLGHPAGDELLTIVAESIKHTFKRSSDIMSRGDREEDKTEKISRFGGDEFAAYSVSKATEREKNKRTSEPQQETERQIEKVNYTLSQQLKGTKFEKFNVSLSMGSAIYTKGDTAESIFAKADMAMFEVKYRGKMNRITGDDIERLRIIIPYIESLGSRVEAWLKKAIEPVEAA